MAGELRERQRVGAASVNQRLGAFAAELRLDDVPEAVVARAKDCLIHGLVVGAAGVSVGFGEAAEAALGAVGGGDALIIGSGRTAPAPLAAFANGALLHARAQEDTHGTFHPGVTAIPAALAAAQAARAGGATLLAGVIAGYEVGTAVSGVLTDQTTPPFRATGVFGPIAAAGAAGRVAGLDAAAMSSAIALAAAFAGGSSESFGAGTDEWHYQSGMASAAGVLAAQLARAGVAGSPSAFEGPAGYLACFAGAAGPVAGLGEELGTRWGIMDVTFKPYPVCAFNQASAMLAVELATDQDLRPEDVAHLVIRMNPREALYPGMGFVGPFERLAQTVMSTRFGVAAALARRDVDFAALQAFHDDAILRLVDRIEIVAEPGRPAKTSSMTLTLHDGVVHERTIEDSGPRLRWDADGVRANAARLWAERGLRDDQLAALISAIDGLDVAPDLDELLVALGPVAAREGS